MQVGVTNASAMMTLQVLRIQTPSMPVASTIAALDTVSTPKPTSTLLGPVGPQSGTTTADAESAYAEF